MFKLLGSLVARYWAWVILAWIGLAAGLHGVAPKWQDVTHDGDLAYLPAAMPSVQGELLMARAFPDKRSKSQMAVIVERPDGPFAADDFAWADTLAASFEQAREELGVLEIWTRATEVVGEKLLSRPTDNGQATAIVLQMSNEFMATDNIRALKLVESILATARQEPDFPPGLNVGVSGSAAIGGDMLASAAESIRNTEHTTVILVIVILLLVYRAPVLVVIPLVAIVLSLLVATSTLALLTQLNTVRGFEWWNFKVFATTRIFIVVILFGAGTDFCLFLIARFKEELECGLSRADAVAEAVSQVGEALLGSALTTIFGLGMMYFADFGKFRNGGPAIAMALAITLVACLTLAPALLRACGGLIFWPFGLRSRQPAVEQSSSGATGPGLFGGFWSAVSRGIIARPGLILVASLLLLLPLAFQGFSVKITYDFLNELAANRPSVYGTALARRHFPAGETAPVTLLALKDKGGFNRPSGEHEIARLTKLLYDVDGVVSVRSIAEPLGDPPGFFQPFRSSGLKKLAARRHHMSQANYLTQVPDLVGDVTRLDVVLQYEPFSREAVDVLNQLTSRLDAVAADESSAWHGAHFTYLGATAGIRDLKLVTESDQRLIQQLVVLVVLAVLLLILRRPLVCLYLILSVLFTYYVTIGATELCFAWLRGPGFDGLDWKVPIFLFVILIAVGEDYNIYLVTRVIEEQSRHGLVEGLRLAVARTGGIITSCGVIMAGTFLSMMSGTLRGMQELGFALSLGVMLDTCIVRPVLVPAFLAIVYRRQERLAACRSSLHAGRKLGGTIPANR